MLKMVTRKAILNGTHRSVTAITLFPYSQISVQEVSDNIILALNRLDETDIRGVVLTYVHRIIADSLCGIDTSAYETDRKPPLNVFFSQVAASLSNIFSHDMKDFDTECWPYDCRWYG